MRWIVSIPTSARRAHALASSGMNELFPPCLLCARRPQESLLECLIAEGFVSDLAADDDMDNLYNKGHYMLGILVTSSLLESGGDYHHVVKMHPMVRAMALWAATDCGRKESRWLVRTGTGLDTIAAPRAQRWSSAERISLACTDIRELKEAPACSILKTLLLQSNRFLERICHGFFSFMPCLRLLDLSHTQLTALPSEINLLVTLQYLCLSNTIIRSLPDGIGALVNLRFLLLSRVPVQSIAVGVLNPLTALQVLCMDHCYSSWVDADNRREIITESGGSSRKKIRRQPTSRQGVNLRELQSLRSLHILDIAVQTRHSLEKLSQSKHLAERLRNLHIEDCSELEILRFSPSSLWRHMNRLKGINITGCCGLEDVLVAGGEYSGDGDEEPFSSGSVIGMARIDVPQEPVDIDITLTKRMNTVRLKSLERAKPVPLLPSLQAIVLHDLPKAKIVWQGGSLEHLCSLSISSCNGLEHLVYLSPDKRMAGEGLLSRQQQPLIGTIFPNLKDLELQDLPSMKSICPRHITVDFPNLERLNVVRCNKLKKLNLSAGSLRQLQCASSWWDTLEWDNQDHKSAFSPSVHTH